MEEKHPYFGKYIVIHFPGSPRWVNLLHFPIMHFPWSNHTLGKVLVPISEAPSMVCVCCIFPCYEILMGRPMHFPCNKIRYFVSGKPEAEPNKIKLLRFALRLNNRYIPLKRSNIFWGWCDHTKRTLSVKPLYHTIARRSRIDHTEHNKQGSFRELRQEKCACA